MECDLQSSSWIPFSFFMFLILAPTSLKLLFNAVAVPNCMHLFQNEFNLTQVCFVLYGCDHRFFVVFIQIYFLVFIEPYSDRSSAPEFTRLLSCHCCNARAYATEKELGLIQCSHCLCWFHRLCGGTSFDSKLFSNVDLLSNNELCSPVVCNNCRMVLRPARRSRRNEWRTGLLRSHDLNSEFSKRGLLTDVSSILNKACQLRPLLASGWQILNRSNLPSVSDQVKQDSGVFKNAYQDASKPSEFPTSKFAGSIKHTAPVIHTPEDQVNRKLSLLNNFYYQYFIIVSNFSICV